MFCRFSFDGNFILSLIQLASDRKWLKSDCPLETLDERSYDLTSSVLYNRSKNRRKICWKLLMAAATVQPIQFVTWMEFSANKISCNLTQCLNCSTAGLCDTGYDRCKLTQWCGASLLCLSAVTDIFHSESSRHHEFTDDMPGTWTFVCYPLRDRCCFSLKKFYG